MFSSKKAQQSMTKRLSSQAWYWLCQFLLCLNIHILEHKEVLNNHYQIWKGNINQPIERGGIWQIRLVTMRLQKLHFLTQQQHILYRYQHK